MKDKNQTVKLNSSDIYIYLEPNTNSNLLRFAIYNPSHSRIKFLHNNNIYKSDDVQKAQSDFYCCRLFLHASACLSLPKARFGQPQDNLQAPVCHTVYQSCSFYLPLLA